MKARVKATGEIIVVRGIYTPTIRTFGIEEIESYDMEAVEIITDPDYWTRLEHQYAGQFMQAMISSSDFIDVSEEAMADASLRIAHALVKKLKGKEERK